MQEFTLADLGVFLGVVGGILTSILLTIQKSKCKKIKCCGAECDRKIKYNEKAELESVPSAETPTERP